MTRKYFPFRIILFLLIFTGCIRENTDNCETTVMFNYVYHLHTYNRDLFSEEVEHLQVYIYDGTGVLVTEKSVPIEFMTGNSVSFDLVSGKYTAVTWGNTHTGIFECDDKHELSNVRVGINCFDENGVLSTTDPGSLFHGITEFTVKGGSPYKETVPLTKNYNKINLKIKGIENVSSGDVITSLTGCNAHYSYDNYFHSNNLIISYISGRELDENDNIIECYNVYRLLDNDEDLVLKIFAENADGLIYSFEEPVVPILLKDISRKQQEYLDREDEFFIAIGFDEDGTASVRSWEEVDTST